ncbi:MAG: acyl-CoA dehydrogenase family protein [Solirubrobacteraceae bacterium]
MTDRVPPTDAVPRTPVPGAGSDNGPGSAPDGGPDQADPTRAYDHPPLVEVEDGPLGDVRRRAAAVATAIAPEAARWDREDRFPESSWERLRDAGLLGLTVPRAYGGEGLGVPEACAVLEELAVACMSSAMVAQLYLNGPPRAIDVLGTEEQRRRYLPGAVTGERSFAIAISEPDAGSDATALQTRLEPDGDGYRLHGEKCFITNGIRADTVLVFCRLAGTAGARGIGAVIVESSQDGYAPPRTHLKMGGRGMPEATLRFDGIRIDPEAVLVAPDPESRRAAGTMLRQFNPERCGNAAMTLGVARAALDAAIDHVRTRRQFGREIGEFQGLQWKIADMATRLHAARLVLADAAGSNVAGFPDVRRTAMAKVLANETAEHVCREAIQIHGHSGYTRELPLERYYRDVRGMSLAGGTSEVMRNVLAGEVIGRRYRQR